MAEDAPSSALGGATASRGGGGASSSGLYAGASSLEPAGGATTGGAEGGAGGWALLSGGQSGSSAEAGVGATATPLPNGGASLLGRLGGALPVHPHLDDATGGWLDAYAAVDHTHPSATSGYWTFSTNTSMTDPGSGHLRADTGVLGTATVLALSNTTQPGTALPPIAGTLGPGDSLYVQDRDDNTRWARYDVTADATKFPTYGTIPVAVTASSGTNVANNAVVEIVFSLSAGGGGGGGPLDYARLVLSTTAPAPPEAPSDAFWLNPSEVA